MQYGCTIHQQTNQLIYNSLNVLTDYKEVSYEIYNTLGHLVAKGNLVNNKIDISSLEGSVYQIRFTTEEGIMTKRFIKQ